MKCFIYLTLCMAIAVGAFADAKDDEIAALKTKVARLENEMAQVRVIVRSLERWRKEQTDGVSAEKVRGNSRISKPRRDDDWIRLKDGRKMKVVADGQPTLGPAIRSHEGARKLVKADTKSGRAIYAEYRGKGQQCVASMFTPRLERGQRIVVRVRLRNVSGAGHIMLRYAGGRPIARLRAQSLSSIAGWHWITADSVVSRHSRLYGGSHKYLIQFEMMNASCYIDRIQVGRVIEE